jgi:Predicted membrane protein
MKKKLKGRPSIGIFGLAGVVFFAVCWIIAAAGDPGWVLGENMISDLGASGLDTEVVFNIGCIMGGMLVMVSGIGMTTIKNEKIYFATGIITALAGAFLTMIGLFPEDVGDAHVIFAVLVFAALLVGMIVTIVGDMVYGKKIYFGIGVVLVVLIVFIALTQTFEFLEAAVAILGLVWLSLHSVKLSMIKQ